MEKNGEKCRVLCFYLPQFHRTPENDEWWGTGYTEWTAVKGAKLYFRTQIQPKEPLNDNYYDLADESGSVWKWQSRLARKSGIYGFVIYHYWFGGRKVLDKPVNILLEHPEIDIRYSLCWDNNEWRRTWYGTREEILIPQEYGDEQMWRKHFEDLLPFFRDKRYIKLDNKPVFHIYASSKIDKLSQMKAYWNRLAQENEFSSIYLVAGDLLDRKYQECLDAYYNFEPNRIQVQSRYSIWLHPLIDCLGGFRKGIGKILKKNLVDVRYTPVLYKLIVREKLNQEERLKEKHFRLLNLSTYKSRQIGVKTYRGLYVNYDDTPRRQEKGIVYVGGSPRLLQQALRDLLIKSMKEQKEFLYLNAWNEWGEGAYIEPDKRNKYGYLIAVRNAIREAERLSTRVKCNRLWLREESGR